MMKEHKMTLPNRYAVIGTEEMFSIEGGIGPKAMDDGKYNTYETAGSLTIMLENLFNRIFQPSYSERQTINKGFAGLGVIQTIIKVFNPTAIAEAINFAPFLTGVFDTLGKIGMDRV